MDYMFSLNELYWLDHLLPDATRRKKEDEGDQEGEKKPVVDPKEKVAYEMTDKSKVGVEAGIDEHFLVMKEVKIVLYISRKQSGN